MNPNKISFIVAVNNEIDFNKCSVHINKIIKPDNFEVEIIPIRNAISLTNAYNLGMNKSNGKYKVYLHQDVFIINPNFINDIINLFNLDINIGLIGMCGATSIPDNGIWWESPRLVGKVYDSHTGNLSLLNFNNIDGEFEEVEGVDGLIMITQYDIPWREDVFKGWHFYDLSQCMEFRKKGYKVVVPNQQVCWCIHDCGIVNVTNGYEENRELFIETYKK
ncbi:Glycosyltransferase like family protein [Clostridium cavendishii DSM 21758]|uniref:Glycosyltransferase like family protein n=1 Tax=Clostridium cavendishii DSM 21758 TaxID=1121302 RepID=A0A1M6IQD8_9CLOT|nr:glycosyltransferase family protein [Clostridium cavendishii]SHJ36696.1 Glycosyltransferase like family protein [Clostridium cavendishii DSM 21758]